jgi:sulfate transport system substrate-binding protein
LLRRVRLPLDLAVAGVLAKAFPSLTQVRISALLGSVSGGGGAAAAGSKVPASGRSGNWFTRAAEASRAVVDGKPADLVNFSVEPDVTRLVKAGKVAPDWNADVTKSIPFGSVVTLVVRKGNPKNITDWDDLLRPGIEVVTPSPLSSGSAKWNLLAPYAAKSNGGTDQQAGLDFVRRLVTDHVETRPSSGREATDVFLQGTGDVLLSYENEAIHIERQGAEKGEVAVEHVNPPQTFKIENPVAVLTTSTHQEEALAL